ncbi:SDR family oxidoreductase [Bacillus sp. AFS040349]|uniref:SDR family oxidoreductase n=1 Tax=Bacillus sp. AFS040349 TaxID=2033502 RepID=UPI000BFE9122|nr:SDR family oxidoreductase [Bacillus sp. AFS040349]PGT91572.1 sugar epimerase [Bacillus sp. AFS040349]
MKVFVVGANGQIGKHLSERLNESENYTVLAMVRKEEQQREFENKGIETVIADLEGTVEELQEALNGCDAIVFTAGSGGSTGSDKTLLIDLDGAVKTMEAAEKAGIDRFIMVSALQANNRENWNENLKPYYVAKHYADKMLVQSNLNYTIIRPGGLLNEKGIGKITAGNEVPRATIPREDVATTIIEALENPNTYHKSFDIVSGEDPISTALNNL